MASDSSSDENLERFKDVVDVNFLKDNPYKPSPTTVSVSVLKPSLRKQDDEQYAFNPLNIKVTPEFQKYVSKNLMHKLDDLIKEKKGRVEETEKEVNKKDKGIKLLKGSRKFVKIGEDVKVVLKRRVEDSDSEEDGKVKEAAVKVEWVLNGSDTKWWKPGKGEIEVVTSTMKKKKKRKKKASLNGLKSSLNMNVK